MREEKESPRKKIKLTYLNAKSRAEPIRLALFIGGVPFDDERVSYEEILARRKQGHLPFGQVPVMDIGDGYGPYSQSNALLRWAGRRAGLYPEDLQLQCDIALEALLELRGKMAPFWYGAALGRHPATSEPVVKLTEAQMAEVGPFLGEVLFPERLAQLEQMLQKSGGPFLCGKELTICDLSLYVFAEPILAGEYTEKGIAPSCMDACPCLSALVNKVQEHPRVKEWNAAQRPS